MERTIIIEKLTKVISPYVEDKELLKDVSEESDFMSDLDINSANLIDVILDTEEEFDIEIDDQSAENMFTVKDTVEIILSKLAA